ncbi:MAG TPA: Hsp70 family protein, partial [Cyclobacteriaceae bacterium]
AAEETKIALTNGEFYNTPLDFLEQGYTIPVQRNLFEESIRNEVDKISASAAQCIQLAGIVNDDIELVILTGGSTEVPLIQTEFKRLFPKAAIADENKLSSVGLGLAYDSQNKFR